MRYCAWPRCPNKVQYGYCETHEKTRKKLNVDNRESRHARGYDNEWYKVRSRYIMQHPTCEYCGEPSEEIHHKVSLKDGGSRLAFSNLVALCRICHRRKHDAQDTRNNR